MQRLGAARPWLRSLVPPRRLSTTTAASDLDAVVTRRSLLYVPAASDKMLARSLSLPADSIAFDLEDSVPGDGKTAARNRLVDFLRLNHLHQAETCARINSVGSGHEVEDLRAVLSAPGLQAIVLPKADSADHVNFVADQIEKHGGGRRIKILALIESATALMQLSEIAGAAKGQLDALLFAAEDLCADIGIDRTPGSLKEVLYARSAILIAARAHGLQALDMVCVDYKDANSLASECEDGRRLGYDGKQAIHPSQLETIHKSFQPSQKAIDHAVRVYEAVQENERHGRGAFGLDGAMIDAPVLKRATRVLSKAAASGLSIGAFAGPRSHLKPPGARTLSTYAGMSNEGLTESQIEVRDAVTKICTEFPNDFWMEKDLKGEYAGELHEKLAESGYIGICMPPELGGAGLGISEATVMLQAVSESGAGIAGAQTIHANVYATMPLLRFATEDQKQKYLPPIIKGQHRVCFGVTEPDSGLDTLKLKTRAVQRDDGVWIVNGSKIWITNAQRANRMVLLARTKTLENGQKPSEALSLFYADLDHGRQSKQVEIKPIKKMGGRAVDANMVFFEDFEVQPEDMIGAEGNGFKQILHGMNAERCLLAGEALGLGYAALSRTAQYTSERVVFGRPIAANQAIQHPLADSWCNLEAAKLMTYFAARQYDEGGTSGEYANAAKYLAAEAAYTACERAVTSHGGLGYSAEYHVERYLREVFVPRLAPVSKEMILSYISQRVLGLPRSY